MSKFTKIVKEFNSIYKPKCFAHFYFPSASKYEIKCDCTSKCKYAPPPSAISNLPKTSTFFCGESIIDCPPPYIIEEKKVAYHTAHSNIQNLVK